MTHEEIIKKIQNLFKITEQNGSSKNEAIAAALMAQRLISKYDIAEDELFATKDYEVVEISSELMYRKFKYTLGSIIADNYRCRVYFSKEGRKHRAVFMGRRLDAEAAALIYNHLYDCVNEYANSQSRKYRGHGGGLYGNYYNSACIAFMDGVRSELEKQCHELMLIRPKEVNEAFAKKTRGWGRVDSKLSNYGRVNYDEGFQAGKDAVRSSRLNESSTQLLK